MIFKPYLAQKPNNRNNDANHTIFNCPTPMETYSDAKNRTIQSAVEHGFATFLITSTDQPSLTLGECAAIFHILTL